MFELMKIIHMLALLGGGAAMIGNGLLLKKVMNSDGPPPEMVSTTMRTLGMVGLASIVLLWITGLEADDGADGGSPDGPAQGKPDHGD